uniref:Uncharacterized protein n=1 Tax=Strongyloides papillosus TaxID=174720 RepID=A0A0N5BFY3_STREA
MERNLTEDDGSVTQSDDREAKQIFNSLYRKLTEDVCHPPFSSKNPAESFERLNLPDNYTENTTMIKLFRFTGNF